MSLLRSLILVVALLAAKGAAADDSPPASIDPKHVKVVENATGFDLLIDKAIEGRESKQLSVRYSWGGLRDRVAWVYDAGNRWRVLFQDKPAPTEIADVTLRYSLEPTAKELDEIAAKVRGAVTGFFVALAGADKDAAGLDAFLADVKSPAIDDARASLKRFTTKEEIEPGEAAEKTADTVLLNYMGLVQADGKLSVPASGREAALAMAKRASSLRASTKSEENAWSNLGASPRCGATTLSRDNGLDVDQLASCVAAFVTRTRDAQSALKLSESDLKVAALGKSLAALQAMTPDQAAAVPSGSDESNGLMVATGEALRAYDDARSAARHPDASAPADLNEDPSALALAWLSAAGRKRYDEAQVTGPTVEQIQFALRELHQQEEGRVLLERSAEKVWWDVSTGIVYLGGLDEVVMPLLLAFCPANGCLRKGETAFESWVGFGHSFSADFGVRTTTLGSEDVRSKDRPMLFYGISWNPIYFVRASVGAYSFENAQTDQWNTGWYVGATFNVIHTAQLLGVVGFGSSEVTVKDTEKK